MHSPEFGFGFMILWTLFWLAISILIGIFVVRKGSRSTELLKKLEDIADNQEQLLRHLEEKNNRLR